MLLSLQAVRWWKAHKNVQADSVIYKVGDFSRDATALLLSWILAQRAISATSGTVGGRLKEWDDEMKKYGWTFSNWDIGSTLCERYLEPGLRAWAPVCDELFTVLEKVVQVADTPRFNVDNALVEFLVRRVKTLKGGSRHDLTLVICMYSHWS